MKTYIHIPESGNPAPEASHEPWVGADDHKWDPVEAAPSFTPVDTEDDNPDYPNPIAAAMGAIVTGNGEAVIPAKDLPDLETVKPAPAPTNLPSYNLGADGGAHKTEPLITDAFEPPSVEILQECIETMIAKSNDYQNSSSSIRQADYYPNGLLTIMDIVNTKVLRTRSVIQAMQHDPTYKPNFESLEDSLKDMINYAAFGVSYCRGEIDGQDENHDFLNRAKD
jgi:hypothetical protein